MWKFSRLPSVLALAASLLGLLFAGYSTYDYAQHLDRQLHAVHCTFVPGIAAASDAENACRTAMYSAYSAMFRGTWWGGIPLSLFALGVYIFFAAFAVTLLVAGHKASRRSYQFLGFATLGPLLVSVVMAFIAAVHLGTFCKTCVGLYIASILLAASGVWAMIQLRRISFAFPRPTEPMPNVPAASFPAPNAPASNAPASNAPASNAPASNAPAASVPPPNAPAASVPPPNAPAASVPPPNAPAGSVPPPNAPAASLPPPNAPAASVPAPRAPAASAPEPEGMPLGNAGFIAIWLAALGLCVGVPALIYVNALPDYRPKLSSCGKIPKPASKSLIQLATTQPKRDAIIVADPLCPTCKALHERLTAEGAIENLNASLVLMPLDSTCNWMLDRPVHPGSCILSKAVICAGPRARDALEWMYRNQEELTALGKAGDNALRARLRTHFTGSIDACIDAKNTGQRLNNVLQYAVTNELRVSTPQLFLGDLRICDEDTDLGLRYTLTQLAPEVLQ